MTTETEPTADVHEIEFAQNPEPRCACVILADRSWSMSGEPINQLNKGLTELKKHLIEDPLACLRVEIALISFNTSTTVDVDFTSPERFDPPTLTAWGGTSLGAAVIVALDKLKARTESYRAAGLACFRPWLLIITDAEPTDSIAEAARRVRDAEARKKVAFFAVGVLGANMKKLAEISLRPPLHLDGLKFAELFQWLSNSLVSVSSSRPGEQVPLPAPSWSSV